LRLRVGAWLAVPKTTSSRSDTITDPTPGTGTPGRAGHLFPAKPGQRRVKALRRGAGDTRPWPAAAGAWLAYGRKPIPESEIQREIERQAGPSRRP